MEFRHATPLDARAVAELHTESWRNTYRGILSDDFLGSAVFDDRLTLWGKRLCNPQSNTQLVLLVEDRGELLGFLCIFLDADPRWGALLDNLHIRPDAKHQGLGRHLLSKAVVWVLNKRPDSGLWLWVFESNHEARRFYERLGGLIIERKPQPAPDGTDVIAVRYGWEDLHLLPQACAASWT